MINLQPENCSVGWVLRISRINLVHVKNTKIKSYGKTKLSVFWNFLTPHAACDTSTASRQQGGKFKRKNARKMRGNSTHGCG